jgi:hypothetical protein
MGEAVRPHTHLYWGQIAADLAGPSGTGGQAIGVSTASGSI